jgi:hypothetical protein
MLPDPFTFISVPKDLACEFFAVFSRVEFALKESGFVKGEGRASPDWQRFASEFTLEVGPDSPLAVSLGYLIAHPPQVQTPTLKWKDVALQGNTDRAKALESLQRVRNNLFHGGKHAPYSQPGRDTELVSASLTVLYAMLKQNEQIRSDYETVLF